ncbi:Pycsar system effector family protein [Streptomyces lasiicapitis]|uniref:Pycsar system effector family protein n=1 Tax=Streptomyces lasiicapitis TaxID=1923961 RepID=UPI0033337A75
MTTTRDLSHHQEAADLRRRARRALGGQDPEHDWPISNSDEVATAHACLATATQLGDVSDRLVAIDVDLSRIADAAETQARRANPEPDYTEAELLTVRGEISRTDQKASILLASVAIVAGPVAERGDDLLRQPWPIAVLGLLAALLAATSTWLLLDVVLPRLVGRTNANFLHYATCSPQDMAAALGPDADRRGELAALSAIAKAKFQCLARSGLLLKASALLFTATAGLSLSF